MWKLSIKAKGKSDSDLYYNITFRTFPMVSVSRAGYNALWE